MEALNDTMMIGDDMRADGAGLVQIVAGDGTVIAVTRGVLSRVPSWFPSPECVAAMVSEDS